MPSRSTGMLLLCLLALGALGFAVLALHDTPALVDEGIHSQQVSRFYEGDFAHHPGLTTFPGFHAVVALLARAVGSDGLFVLRALSTLLGLLSILLFWRVAQTLEPERSPRLRSAHFALQPLLFPFFFLVYTDPLSLAGLLAAMGLMTRGRPLTGSLVGAASVLVRQTNIVWLGFLVVWDYGRKHGIQIDRARVGRHLRDHLPALLSVPLFLVFVLWNDGVAMGDRTHHVVGLHLGNVWFFPLVALVAFAPALLSIAPRVWALRHRVGAWLFVVGGFVLYWFTFESPHPYNHVPGHLRNGLFTAMERSDALRAVVFLPIAYGVLALSQLRLARPVDRLIYGFTFLALIPAPLIEQRYMLFPLVALMLFRERLSDRTERLSLAYEAVAAVVVLRGFARDSFFL